MNTVPEMVGEAIEPSYDGDIKTLYLDSLTLVERLHRRLLDVIKDEFDRKGRSDINPVQALLLFTLITRNHVLTVAQFALALQMSAKKLQRLSMSFTRAISVQLSKSVALTVVNLQL